MGDFTNNGSAKDDNEQINVGVENATTTSSNVNSTAARNARARTKPAGAAGESGVESALWSESAECKFRARISAVFLEVILRIFWNYRDFLVKSKEKAGGTAGEHQLLRYSFDDDAFLHALPQNLSKALQPSSNDVVALVNHVLPTNAWDNFLNEAVIGTSTRVLVFHELCDKYRRHRREFDAASVTTADVDRNPMSNSLMNWVGGMYEPKHTLIPAKAAFLLDDSRLWSEMRRAPGDDNSAEMANILNIKGAGLGAEHQLLKSPPVHHRAIALKSAVLRYPALPVLKLHPQLNLCYSLSTLISQQQGSSSLEPGFAHYNSASGIRVYSYNVYLYIIKFNCIMYMLIPIIMRPSYCDCPCPRSLLLLLITTSLLAFQ